MRAPIHSHKHTRSHSLSHTLSLSHTHTLSLSHTHTHTRCALINMSFGESFIHSAGGRFEQLASEVLSLLFHELGGEPFACTSDFEIA